MTEIGFYISVNSIYKKCDHLKINLFIIRPVSENDFVLINFNGKKNKLFDDIQVDTDTGILYRHKINSFRYALFDKLGFDLYRIEEKIQKLILFLNFIKWSIDIFTGPYHVSNLITHHCKMILNLFYLRSKHLPFLPLLL